MQARAVIRQDDEMKWVLCALACLGFSWLATARAAADEGCSVPSYQGTESVPGSDEEAHGSTPEELAQAQYGFLVGCWSTQVTLHRPGQQDFRFEAIWRNELIAGGLVLLQEWSGPYSHGVELRAYDAEENVWRGQNVYLPDPGEWYANEARLIDGEIVVTTHRRDGEVRVISREIYRSVDRDHFTIRTEISRDDGASWRRGDYSLTATRATPR